jgi:Na+-driven multidrug efflux pump
LYASALASAATGSTKNNSSGVAEKPGEGVVRTAAKTSLYSGIGLMVFLLAVARPLIALYIGEWYIRLYCILCFCFSCDCDLLQFDGTFRDTNYNIHPSFNIPTGPEAAASPGLLDAAHSYVKIRALSMPTSLLGGVLQAALLGAKDSVTPLVSILYSTIVNVCGDYLLVNRFHMGLKGAAIATLCAQLAGTVAMIGPARRELLSKGSSLGLLPRWITKRAPDEINAKTFLKFAAPVLTLILGKISAFGFMTNAAAGLPGQPATLAAHQIALSLFFFASPFLEVISQLSQAYLPSYGVLPKEERGRKANAAEWKAESNRLVFRLEKVGILVGALMAGVVGGIIAFLPGIVTKDATVQTAVKPLAATLAAGVALTAPVAVSEGTLIARKELSYLAGVYFVSTALLPPVLRRIRSGGGPVSQVWVCFALFQLFRSACFLGRILTTSGTKDKEE